jgi:sugar lactone lactonase YvrE
MIVTETLEHRQRISSQVKAVKNPNPFNSFIKTMAAVIMAAVVSILSACGNDEPRNFQRVVTVTGFDDKISEPFGIAERDGDIYVSDGQYGKIFKIKSGSERIEFATGLNTPSGVAFDSDGNLLVADSGTSTIRKFDSNGTVSTIAGIENKRGFADGEASAATFSSPVGITINKNGKIFVSDTYNDRIRVIENGVVRTLAGGNRGYADGSGIEARFDTPLGIAIWGERLLVADAGNRRLRVVEPDGSVWTLAGDGSYELRDGLPLLAGFVRPTAVSLSADGVIYVADSNAIRMIGGNVLAFVETISGGGRGFRDGTLRASQFNRPSGIAFNSEGELLIADSDNGLVRKLAFADKTAEGKKGDKTQETAPEPALKQITAEEFRTLQPPRWPYDLADAKRDIAGTLGEIRGGLKDASSQAWFHNGLDIAGGYGEVARFVRDEKVLDPLAADNFNTLRELIRMPTLGYIHIRLGRDANNVNFGDERFVFDYDPVGKAMSGVRVPRGAAFKAGEAIGTLNAMNHVHLVAGRSGSEMNALAALSLPGVSDSVLPVIEKVTLFDESWNEIETTSANARIKLTGKTRVVVRAFDRMDGNPERRRLGLYRLGYTVTKKPAEAGTQNFWTITFDKMPPNDAVRFVYAQDSHSGATGETIFNYIVTNRLDGKRYGEGFIDPATLSPGQYTIRVSAEDFFGNTATKDISIEVN